MFNRWLAKTKARRRLRKAFVRLVEENGDEALDTEQSFQRKMTWRPTREMNIIGVILWFHEDGVLLMAHRHFNLPAIRISGAIKLTVDFSCSVFGGFYVKELLE